MSISALQEIILFNALMKQHGDSIVFKEYFAQVNGEFIGGKIICASAAKASHYNLTMDEICGLTDFDLMPHDQAQKAYEDDLWVMKNSKPMKDQRETITHANGEVVSVSVTKTPLMRSDGTVWGVMSVTRNITIREKAKAQAVNMASFMRRSVLGPLEQIYPDVQRSTLGKPTELGKVIKLLIIKITVKLRRIEFVDQ
jgi:PAS domain S-box-containing protein